MRAKTKRRLAALREDRDFWQRRAGEADRKREEVERDLALTMQARDQNGDALIEARTVLNAAHVAVGPDGDGDLVEGIRAVHRQRRNALDTLKAWLDSHSHHLWEERERKHDEAIADLAAELAALRKGAAAQRRAQAEQDAARKPGLYEWRDGQWHTPGPPLYRDTVELPPVEERVVLSDGGTATLRGAEPDRGSYIGLRDGGMVEHHDRPDPDRGL